MCRPKNAHRDELVENFAVASVYSIEHLFERKTVIAHTHWHVAILDQDHVIDRAISKNHVAGCLGYRAIIDKDDALIRRRVEHFAHRVEHFLSVAVEAWHFVRPNMREQGKVGFRLGLAGNDLAHLETRF